MTHGSMFNVARYVLTIEQKLMEWIQPPASEVDSVSRFQCLFEIPELHLRVSKEVQAASGQVVIQGEKVREVVQFVSPEDASAAHIQCAQSIVQSHSFPSDFKIQRIFCWNGEEFSVVEAISSHFQAFLQNPEYLRACFEIRSLGKLPLNNPQSEEERVRFRLQMEHLYRNWFEEIGVRTELKRERVTMKSIQDVYERFEQLVPKQTEDYFIRFAPLWTRSHFFHYVKSQESFSILDHVGFEITKIPAENIHQNDQHALELFLKTHVLESPEVFYDQFHEFLKKDQRKKLGNHFPKKDIVSFAQYTLAQNIPHLSTHHVIDPAAGAGSLLEGFVARSVMGSDRVDFKNILMAERQISHPEKSVDFLKSSPSQYLSLLNHSKKDAIRDPLLIFTNPPSFGNAPRTELEESLQDEIEENKIKARDLYVYFMIQISRLFDANSNGLGQDLEGYVCIFTPNTWIYADRGEQQGFRDYILSRFSYEAGFIVDGCRFFSDLIQPVVFSVLKRKKNWKCESGLQVDVSRILDLTKHHEKVSQLARLWSHLPAVGRFGFEDPINLLSEHTYKRLTQLKNTVSTLGKSEVSGGLVQWAKSLPRFSKVLLAAHSHSGNNELALSSQFIRTDADVELAIQDFQMKLNLSSVSEEIATHLQLVFDDRFSTKGYRFLYHDRSRFSSQRVLRVDAPILNYFEEFRKSYSKVKFYNAPPITSDIAAAPVGSMMQTLKEVEDELRLSDLPGDVILIQGFKKLLKNSQEYKYLSQFESVIGDLRALHFLRAFINEVEPFKEVVKDKSVNASLVWLPELRQNKKSLVELVALSFAYLIAMTPFDSFEVNYQKRSWKVKDYFLPDGWLTESGLLRSLHFRLLPQVSPTVRKACLAAIQFRRRKTPFDSTELLKLGKVRFEEAGFLPDHQVVLAKVA